MTAAARQDTAATLGPRVAAEPPRYELERRAQALELRLLGAWRMELPRPGLAELEAELAHGPAGTLRLDGAGIGAWDSALLLFLARCEELAAARGIALERARLPAGVQRLLDLAASHRPRAVDGPTAELDLIERIGATSLRHAGGVHALLEFLGELVLAAGSALRRRTPLRGRDLLQLLEEHGPRALPIVTLISVIVGLILTFVGASQLRRFGAEVFVADLLAIAMVREMGALMTAVILAGRTGAAFAAQLGTMQVTEELDALRTFGIDPMGYLVLPRILAMLLMVPLLCLYADLLGILGGALVATTMLDLSLQVFLQRLTEAISFGDVMVGVAKGAVFGVLVGIAGCLRGLQARGGAGAVGQATTSAVVTAIVAIVVADGVFAVVLDVLGL